MAEIFGLDFGTTNSLAARIRLAGDREVADPYLDVTGAPHPSVVAFHGEHPTVGREAYAMLERTGEGVIDNAVRSPKSALGTGDRFTVGGRAREPGELVTLILRHVIDEARAQNDGRAFDDAVMTIPVDMDGRARRELREAARNAGVRVHQFVHEPLAALYAYLRESGSLQRALAELGEAPVLVVDWGGGTLDLTVCRVVGSTLVQIQSRGEHNVGGDRFDELVRNLVRRRHAEAHGLTSLENVQVGAPARLLTECEQAKKTLSDRDDALVFVSNYLANEGESAHVEVEITREELDDLSRTLIDQAMDAITDVLEAARVDDLKVGRVLLTGGMSRMPAVRHGLERRFGIERVPDVPNADRLIAHGAAWIAHDAQRLRLAKPFEITIADQSPAELLPVGHELPIDEGTDAHRFPVFCLDPSFGKACMIFTRPVDPGRAQTTDRRISYGMLQLRVDDHRGPLEERLNLDVVVDSDLVVRLTVTSDLTDEVVSREVHDLEFGLGIGGGGA